MHIFRSIMPFLVCIVKFKKKNQMKLPGEDPRSDIAEYGFFKLKTCNYSLEITILSERGHPDQFIFLTYIDTISKL